MPRSYDPSEVIPGVGVGAARSTYSGKMRERVVLAAASVNKAGSAALSSNYGRADSAFTVTLTPPELQRMCKKHPRGKLFNIPDSVGTSLFDWEGRPIMGRLSAKLYELVLLRRQFPQAKQVIFIPMFHANLNRWTSCFAFSNSRFRIFTYEMDYLPTLSFCNLIRSEFARLGNIVADVQKNDFIGSVGHELRSPLHGILASIEFLQDTECDTFQRSCVDTMDACAHTLLDTISMVLDYSKVHTRMGRPGSESQQPGPNVSSGGGMRQEPLFTAETPCDVALVTEEVVDGLAMGHLAKMKSSSNFNDDPTANRTLSNTGIRPSLKRLLNAVRPEVEIILDIQGSCDWCYATQPGAIRRIVMNLFANALKYTTHGSITVSLRLLEPQALPRHSVKFADERPTHVKVIVKDTGQGMSPDYLRTKIFTAFAQENARGDGTGLGLSIVKSIIDLLRGEIDVRSIVNVGTIVTVTLPMKKTYSAFPTSAPDSPAGGVGKDVAVSTLQNLQHPPECAIYEPSLEFDSFGQTHGAAAVHSALTQYLTNWFGFPVLQTWDFDSPAAILIVDEIHLPTLLAQQPDFLDKPSRQSMIILCANPTRQATLSRDIKSCQVELICKPFGPFKLARTISRALERAARSPSVGTPMSAASLSSLDASNQAPGVSAMKRSSSSISSHVSSVTSATASSLRRPLHELGRKFSNDFRLRGKVASAASDSGYPFPVVVSTAASNLSRTTTPLNAQHSAVRPESTAAEVALDVARQHEKERESAEDEPDRGVAAGSHGKAENLEKTSDNAAATKCDQSGTSQQQADSEKKFKNFAHASVTPFALSNTSSPDTPQSKGILHNAVGLRNQAPESADPSEVTSQHMDRGQIGSRDVSRSSQTRKPRLLLVDDNRLNLNLLDTFVKKRGYGEDLCHLAEDGWQAVNAFEQFTPDVVLMDISMPQMDGLEATRRIRTLEANRRDSDLREKTSIEEGGPRPTKPALVVALTGNAKPSDEAEALRSGVDVYMTKPVSFKQVGKLLDNWREESGE